MSVRQIIGLVLVAVGIAKQLLNVFAGIFPVGEWDPSLRALCISHLADQESCYGEKTVSVGVILWEL